jgi:trimeric autotransporter adhesin
MHYLSWPKWRASRCAIAAACLAALLLVVMTGFAYAQQITIPGAGVIDTIAGNGTAGFLDNVSPATSGELYRPYGLAIDSGGNVYIADFDNARIRKVTFSTWEVSTVAGSNSAGGFSGDGNAATGALLNDPASVALDSAGNIYIADYGNNRIRVVNTTGSQITIAGVSIGPGDINTVAGNGAQSEAGDNGAPTSASLDGPSGVAVDAKGNIYIADAGGDRIRAVNVSSGRATIAGVSIAAGTINTIAGGSPVCSGHTDAFGDGCPATEASLSAPAGVALDGAGNVYIADTSHSEIRTVNASTGIIYQLAGDGTEGYNNSDNMLAINAELSEPYRVAVNSAGNLVYISDAGNNRIRAVNTGAQTVTIATVSIPAGYIDTVAGNGTPCASPTTGCGDDAAATSAQLDYPSGVAADTSGNIYVGDSFDNKVRAVGDAALIEMDGGTLTGSSAGLSASGATITQYNNITGTLGTVSFSTGSLTVGSLPAGGTFNGGGSVVVSTNGSDGSYNGTIFSGSFNGTAVLAVVTLANGTHEYTLSGSVANVFGQSGVLQSTFNTGKGFFNGATTLSTGSVTF